MTCKCEQSRRQFLRTASMASMAGIAASPFLLELNTLAAMAQGTGSSGYKALVCVFLQGGNDGHGSVIATDTDSFAAFTAARSGAPGLAYPLANLLPIKINPGTAKRPIPPNTTRSVTFAPRARMELKAAWPGVSRNVIWASSFFRSGWGKEMV